MMVNLAGNYLNAGVVPERWGTGHASIVPYQTFPTRDGYLTIGCGNNAQFRQLCECIGDPSLHTNLKFLNNEDRVKNRMELVSIIAERLSEKSNQTWCELFAGASFPFGPVNSMPDVFSDPQVKFNQLQQTVSHSSLGEISQVGPAVEYSKAENCIRSGPPTLGEHTAVVLKHMLGYSNLQIRRLQDKQIIS